MAGTQTLVPRQPGTVFAEERDRLWRSLYAYVGDREIASDAVAESFAQAIRRWESLRDPVAWIWAVAYRIASRDLQERRTTAPLGEHEGPPLWEESPTLLLSLSALTQRQRAVVILYYYVDWPVKRIAEVLAMSPVTVRVHLAQGRRRLRAVLEDEDDG